MERNTQQRQAIVKVFEKSGRPLSVQETLEQAQKKVPGLGVATVYRNLKALVADGQLTTVDMPGGAIMYELPKEGHHHHFACVGCQKVFDIDMCGLNLQKLVPPGFKLQNHELFLSGFCKSCA